MAISSTSHRLAASLSSRRLLSMQRPNFAVRAISEGLRKESDKIRCTCVYPGVVESELANTISDRIALERMHSYRKMAIQPDAMKNPKCPPYGSYSKIRRLPALYGQVTVPDGGERGRAVSVISTAGSAAGMACSSHLALIGAIIGACRSSNILGILNW